MFTTFEGDNTVLMLQVAKSQLSDFQREFRDMNLLGMARFMVEEVTTRMTELNPVVTRKTDPGRLRGLDFQRGAFEYRANHMLQNVGQRLKRRIDDDLEPFDAFVDVQDHLVQLAHAEAERVVLNRFVGAIESVGDAALREPLTTLRQLFALSRIEADLDWFLEAGYATSTEAKAIRGEVNALVDAFGIPDALLAAPIGKTDGAGPV